MIPVPEIVLAFLSRYCVYLIGGAALLLVLGAGWGYWKWSRAEIAALREEIALVQRQADALKQANEALRADMAAIKRATDAANAAMADARSRAQQAARAVRTQDLRAKAQSDPQELERQINRDTAEAFRQLEDLTRNAP